MSDETTPIYWQASGVSLHTGAWNVKTFGGTRNAPVSRRGDDFTLPYRPGRMWNKKVRDGRSLTLPMWMIPMNPDGSYDGSMSLEAKMHANWAFLVSLFDTEEQFPLVKRWWEGQVVKSATALAELAGGMEPTSSGGYRLEFDVDLSLSDPYFYAPSVSSAIGTIVVPGTAPTNHITLTIPNGRVTFADGNWIQYNGSGTAVIDVQDCTAKVGSTYVNGQITRNTNFPNWPTLTPGSNALTGSGTISYEAAYK